MATPQLRRHSHATNATNATNSNTNIISRQARQEGKERRMDIERVASAIVDAAFEIHRHLGPGLLESAYEVLMAKELERKGFEVERRKPLALEFKGIRVEDAFRVDLLVGGSVIVELKSVERLAPVHWRQVLTYLRLLDLHLGFLINFGEFLLKNGLHRVVRDYRPLRS